MSKTKAFSNLNTPLTPSVFHILLALALKERHGYDIMKQVEKDSNGKITLGAGTLYGAIKRLLEDKLIVELTNPKPERRKYYQLTDKGRTIFSNEMERYNEMIKLAKKRRLLGNISVTKFDYIYG